MIVYHNNGSWNYTGDSVFFTSSNISNQSQPVDDTTIFRAVLMSFMISVTGTGNALVILGFITNKNLRTSSNYFLLNLAISDFFQGTFSLPLYLKNYIINEEWVLGKSICKLWLTVNCTLCQCTIYNIVLISSDRFLAVTKAVKYRDQQHKLKPAFMKMAAVWILAFLNFGPAVILWEYTVGYSVVPDGKCAIEFNDNGRYLLFSSVFDFFMPMSAIAFFNISIYINIRSRMKSKVQNIGHNSREVYGDERSNGIFFVECKVNHSCCATASTHCKQEHGARQNKNNVEYFFSFFKTKKRYLSAKQLSNEETNGAGTLDLIKTSALAKDVKIAKSLAILVCTFCICWAPSSFFIIISEGFYVVFVSPIFLEITFWLLYFNSLINPFLYPLCHPIFKQTLLRLICIKKP